MRRVYFNYLSSIQPVSPLTIEVDLIPCEKILGIEKLFSAFFPHRILKDVRLSLPDTLMSSLPMFAESSNLRHLNRTYIQSSFKRVRLILKQKEI